MATRLGPQGQQVLAVLSESRTHFTVEDIQTRLPEVGVATVYRNLEALEQKGLIKKLHLGGKSAYYEYARERHLHFLCDRCGGVFDLPCDPGGLLTEVSRFCGHEMHDFDVVCRGVCKECREKEGQN